MTLHKDLREFVELLNSRSIDYVIVGAFAVGKHGFPRSTGDIDFLVRVSNENANKLERVFADFGLKSLELRADDFLEFGQTIQVGRPPNRIDVLTSISGVSFEEVWASREPAEIDGIPVSFIAKDLLIRNKRAAGRPKDLIDAAELESI